MNKCIYLNLKSNKNIILPSMLPHDASGEQTLANGIKWGRTFGAQVQLSLITSFSNELDHSLNITYILVQKYERKNLLSSRG